jgi:hypothetical protein
VPAAQNIDCGVSRPHNPLGLSRPCRDFPNRSIDDLRNLLAARFPHPDFTPRTGLNTRRQSSCNDQQWRRIHNTPTGLDPLDQIAGGLPKSAITELISPQTSAGSASAIHRIIQAAHSNRSFIALIDGCDSFDPSSLGQPYLRHLLWVRCCKSFEAIKAADLLLRDGNFPLVIIDLVLNPAAELRKIPQTSWYRLQRLAEATSSACLVLTRQSIVSSAQLKIVLENSWTLRELENETTIRQLRFRIQRSHFHLETGEHRAVGAGTSRTDIILGHDHACPSTSNY